MELETKGAVIFMKKKIIVLLTIAILSLCNTSVFAEESGYMWTQGESGLWYYVDTEGNCKTGWQYINGCWYYMDVNGIMTTGWQYINNHWYYMDANGAMTTGWQYISNFWY